MTELAAGRRGDVSLDAGSRAGRLAARRRWMALAALTLVSFLLLLDDTAVAVALPTLQGELGIDLGGQTWVINAYTLTLAALTLPAGRLADRYGRRRSFLTGLAVFLVASLVAGASTSGMMLVTSRAIQGFGAALLAPASLAIIAATFPAASRGGAIGLWAGVSASALGLGPLFGAVVTDSLGWAWIFWLNVPLGLAAWLIGRAVIEESHAGNASGTVDALGVGLSAATLLALTTALSRGNDAGWGAPSILALLTAAIVAAVLFVVHERHAADPLLPPAWFRDRSFAGANVVTMLSTSVMCSLFFFLSLYLQTVLGYTSLRAGLGLLPLTVTIVLTGPLAGRLTDRIGARVPTATGMLILAVALLGLSGLAVDEPILRLTPWFTLAGAGIGLVTAPTTAAAMGTDERAGYGATAAVFNTFRTTGLTLGVAIMGAILASFGPAAAFGRNFDRQHHAAFVDGFSAALTVNAIIAFIGAALAAYMLRNKTPGSPRAAVTRCRHGRR